MKKVVSSPKSKSSTATYWQITLFNYNGIEIRIKLLFFVNAKLTWKGFYSTDDSLVKLWAKAFDVLYYVGITPNYYEKFMNQKSAKDRVLLWDEKLAVSRFLISYAILFRNMLYGNIQSRNITI